MQHNRVWMRGWLEGVTLIAIVLAFSGCSTPRYLPADGLPADQYLVGGGLMIDWKAPSEGTAYLVEKTTGRIIETRSMEAGDSFGFSVSSGPQATEFERTLGIKFADARLLLYFKPIDSSMPRYRKVE